MQLTRLQCSMRAIPSFSNANELFSIGFANISLVGVRVVQRLKRFMRAIALAFLHFEIYVKNVWLSLRWIHVAVENNFHKNYRALELFLFEVLRRVFAGGGVEPIGSHYLNSYMSKEERKIEIFHLVRWHCLGALFLKQIFCGQPNVGMKGLFLLRSSS